MLKTVSFEPVLGCQLTKLTNFSTSTSSYSSTTNTATTTTTATTTITITTTITTTTTTTITTTTAATVLQLHYTSRPALQLPLQLQLHRNYN